MASLLSFSPSHRGFTAVTARARRAPTLLKFYKLCLVDSRWESYFSFGIRFLTKSTQHVGSPEIDRKLVSAIAPELPVATIILLLEHIAISKC